MAYKYCGCYFRHFRILVMTKKRKRLIISLAIIGTLIPCLCIGGLAVFLTYGFIHVNDGYELINDIKNYNGKGRMNGNGLAFDYGACYYENIPFFYELFSYNDCYFRYEYFGPDYKQDTIQETILMAFTFEEIEYEKATQYIYSDKHFSKEADFSFSSYSFNLNDEIYYHGYSFSTDKQYISNIKLVGISEEKQSIMFISFFFQKTVEKFLFFDSKFEYYHFSDWPTFFSDFFSFYKWN